MLIYIVNITLNKGILEKQRKVIWITFRLLIFSSLFYSKKGVIRWQETLKVLRLNYKVMSNH
uniref:Uncharacterized protein n=1 Tax=Siphoviridae sp. ctfR912 TaxID=2825596 RepID=A0A8S5QBM0_9CAUD|nr:MAG TPA: hypothetical protein [Siphoviridae sp. ctfR912]